jgi:FAD dependent oxidoreductase
MAKMTIVGSGILGLSVAEFLSREMLLGNEIQIITNYHKYSGSKAAAANLATKGQLFGRDKHFQLKLEGKKQYPKWLSLILNETQNRTPIDEFYRKGFGLDYFTSQENREKHFNRVKQSYEELLKRNFTNNSITKIEENKIMYADEAWVDAQFLLSILKDLLIKRGVHFIQADFSEVQYHYLLECHDSQFLIFCTGAWTKSLLNKLEIKLPRQMEKQERLTIGSTYFGNKILNNFDKKFVLHEIISGNLKTKVTFSGYQCKYFISSSTLKLNSINDFDEDNLNIKNIELFDFAKNVSYNSPYLKNSAEIKVEENISKLDGFRVGFGHSEIILEKLDIPNSKINAVVCAGAHKSGYLFAPVVGSMMQNLLLGNS